MKRILPLFLIGILNPACVCHQVPPGHVGVKTSFGEIQMGQVLPEGLHGKWPVQDTIYDIPCRVQKKEIAASASSKDIQEVSTQIALNYRLDCTKADKGFKDIGTLEVVGATILDPALQEAVKKVTAKFTAAELITRRQEVKQSITREITATATKSYVLVTELSITNFKFNPLYQKAIEDKQVAEQKALTAKNDLNRIRVEAEQVQAKAVGAAQAEVARAEAEAKAQELLRKTITPEIVMLRAIEKWDGKMPQIVGGDGVGMKMLGAVVK